MTQLVYAPHPPFVCGSHARPLLGEQGGSRAGPRPRPSGAALEFADGGDLPGGRGQRQQRLFGWGGL
jgi:hypothetical protein